MTRAVDPWRLVALRAHGAMRFLDGVQGALEDIEGALEDRQFEVAAFQARYLVTVCLSIRSLACAGEVDFDEESLSFDPFAGLPDEQVAFGLRIASDALDIDASSASAWQERLRRYVAETEELLGYDEPLPSLREPQGILALLRLARRWQPHLQELGLPPLLSLDYWLTNTAGPPATAEPRASESAGEGDRRPPRGETAPGTPAGPDRAQVLATYRRHMSVSLAHFAELMRAGVEVRASGAHLWDATDRRYLDCGGYGVFILGHCHPRVVEAVVAQVRRLPLSSSVLLNAAEAGAAEALLRVAPPGLDHVFFAGSGTEAVEAALKLGRLSGRRRVIAMENGYHGMTMGALSAVGREAFRQPFLPLLPDVERVPFGDAAALEGALAVGERACVLLEPVQGEGGVVIPPSGYLSAVQAACRSHDALLVLDEIQTGMGRLGTFWGADREALAPDLLLAGKSLSGGVVPVSAVLGSAGAFERLSRDPLLHTSTFSGAPIAMAAARAAVEAIEQEDIVGRAAVLGERLRALLATAVHDTCPGLVREVRGLGLMVGIEWQEDYLGLDFLLEMFDRGVIVSHSMNTARVVRFTPSALLGEEDLEQLDAAVRASGRALVERVGL